MGRTEAGRRARRTTIGLLITLALIGPGSLVAEAQQHSAGRSSASAHVGVVIPNRLLLRSLGQTAVVSPTADYSVIELRVEAAANVRWTLTSEAISGAVELLDEFDRWLPLAGQTRVTLIGEGQPTNPRILTIRIRVPTRTAGVTDTLVGFRLSSIASPNQGAVIVSWSGSVYAPGVSSSH